MSHTESRVDSLPADELVTFARKLTFDELSPESKEMAKKCILDTVGVILAGVDEPSSGIVREQVTAVTIDEGASILGRNETVPAQFAGLVNGVQGHALDFDDVSYYTFSLHPSVTLVPTLLALGETTNATGRELITSFVAGFEFENRVAGGVGGHLQENGYHPTCAIGTFGSTVAAARLLELDAEQFNTAIGVAASLYSGSTSNFGTMTKPYHAGLANENGIKAATLAERGFDANTAVLNETSGPWPKVFDQYDLGPLTDDLGEYWYTGAGIDIKRYPSCGCTHCGIPAALSIREQLGPEEVIDEIAVYSVKGAYESLQYHDPDTPLEGKFSMPYCVTTALLDGELTLDHFTQSAINREDVGRLIDVTTFEVREELSGSGYVDGGFPATVVVKTQSGRKLEETVRPDSSTTISWSDLDRKFKVCASHIISEPDAAAVLEDFKDIERVEDISDIKLFNIKY